MLWVKSFTKCFLKISLKIWLFAEKAFYVALNGCSGLSLSHIESFTQPFSVAVVLNQSLPIGARVSGTEHCLETFPVLCQLYVHVPKTTFTCASKLTLL